MIIIKLWLDDVRPAPEGYVWCKSVNMAKDCIEYFELCADCDGLELDEETIAALKEEYTIVLIDIDHDAGDYAYDGGDFIKLLDWLEETGRNYPIRIHSMNPVGVANMRRIIERNSWKEIK